MKWQKEKPQKTDCWFLTDQDSAAFPSIKLWYLRWDFTAIDAHGNIVNIGDLHARQFLVIERGKLLEEVEG